MILSSSPGVFAIDRGQWLVWLSLSLYALAVVPRQGWPRLAAWGLLGGFVLHALLLVADISGLGRPAPGARLGFGPVLSMAVWLVIAVYAIESRLLPLPAVRRWLGLAGMGAVLLAATFPGDPLVMHSPLAPLHFALGVACYGLVGAAVLHALWLDGAERRLRRVPQAGAAAGLPDVASPARQGMPLLQLERITFRFVEVGFVVLSATLALGAVSAINAEHGRWIDHKTVFSALAWCVLAALLLGRRLRGWRGRQATRWLYAGALLLLLGYAGSRFVLEVVLGRSVS